MALNFFPSSFNPIEINPTPTWELLVSDHGSTDRTIEHKDAPIFLRFNRLESFIHRSSAGFTIITAGFEFSVHTAIKIVAAEKGR